MPIDSLQALDIIEAMENFIERRRPPENLRDQLDLSYRIEGQSIVVFEIRPRFNKPSVKLECSIAKTTFVKAKNHWKIFWKRADLKWHSYGPAPTVNSIEEFVKLIEEDKYSCFWG